MQDIIEVEPGRWVKKAKSRTALRTRAGKGLLLRWRQSRTVPPGNACNTALCFDLELNYLFYILCACQI